MERNDLWVQNCSSFIDQKLLLFISGSNSKFIIYSFNYKFNFGCLVGVAAMMIDFWIGAGMSIYVMMSLSNIRPHITCWREKIVFQNVRNISNELVLGQAAIPSSSFSWWFYITRALKTINLTCLVYNQQKNKQILFQIWLQFSPFWLHFLIFLPPVKQINKFNLDASIEVH